MHDSNTCNTVQIRFKGKQLMLTHDLLLHLRKDIGAIEIRFVTRLMQVFVGISCVLFEFNYYSPNLPDISNFLTTMLV